MSDHPIRVLFVCEHNAARSQMAEALLRKVGGDRFIVESAGFEPRPVNPIAVEAMRRAGVDISEAKPQQVFALFRAGRHYQYVIAVCDEASGERCPIFPGVVTRLQWSFPDPATFVGTDAEKLAKVEALRDAIHARVVQWIDELGRTPSDARRGP